MKTKSNNKSDQPSTKRISANRGMLINGQTSLFVKDEIEFGTYRLVSPECEELRRVTVIRERGNQWYCANAENVRALFGRIHDYERGIHSLEFFGLMVPCSAYGVVPHLSQIEKHGAINGLDFSFGVDVCTRWGCRDKHKVLEAAWRLANIVHWMDLKQRNGSVRSICDDYELIPTDQFPGNTDSDLIIIGPDGYDVADSIGFSHCSDIDDALAHWLENIQIRLRSGQKISLDLEGILNVVWYLFGYDSTKNYEERHELMN